MVRRDFMNTVLIFDSFPAKQDLGHEVYLFAVIFTNGSQADGSGSLLHSKGFTASFAEFSPVAFEFEFEIAKQKFTVLSQIYEVTTH